MKLLEHFYFFIYTILQSKIDTDIKNSIECLQNITK